MTEAFYGTGSAIGTGGDAHGGYSAFINLDASRSSSIYGNSNTVQPPAIILLPCIKAFDTVLNVTEINAHGLASEVSVKANRADIEPYLSKAWVNFDASAGIVKIKNSRNIQGVVHVEKGVYDVIFDNSMEADAMTVTASSSALLTSVNRESLTGAYYPPTKDRIRIVTGSGYPPAAEDAARYQRHYFELKKIIMKTIRFKVDGKDRYFTPASSARRCDESEEVFLKRCVKKSSIKGKNSTFSKMPFMTALCRHSKLSNRKPGSGWKNRLSRFFLNS